MTNDLTALAQRLLGPEVAVVAGRVAELQEPLWAGEAAYVARAIQSRQAEFVAGRTAARRAMAMLGRKPDAILKDAGGAPVWPEGIIGSLTHGGGWCLAAVTPRVAVRALGVDLEPISLLEPSLVEEVCTAEERGWIAAQPDPDDLPLRVFTAKEAAYKALYPLSGIVLEFTAMDVRVDRQRSGFTARLNTDIGPFSRGQVITGGQGMASGLILSTVKIVPNSL